jgi:hypothetical protein
LTSLTADAGAVRTFIDVVGSAAVVDLVEIRVPDDVADLRDDGAQVLTAFPSVVAFEVSWGSDLDVAFDALARLRDEAGRSLLVKIRCGGLDAGSFPPPGAVAHFLHEAVIRGLPVKATAALHHPYRHTDPNTGFTHHGFVNLLMASALAHAGAAIDEITGVLADADPASFRLDRGGLGWGDHLVGHDAVAAMRSGLFVGYGSCSFEDPVADLTTLGVLPL